MVVQSLVDLFSKCLCNCDNLKFLFFNKSTPFLQPDLENIILKGDICITEVKQYDEVGNWEYVDNDHRKYL